MVTMLIVFVNAVKSVYSAYSAVPEDEYLEGNSAMRLHVRRNYTARPLRHTSSSRRPDPVVSLPHLPRFYRRLGRVARSQFAVSQLAFEW